MEELGRQDIEIEDAIDRAAAQDRRQSVEANGPKPQWGVRLKVGVVTYFNDEPLLTWEQAQEARQKIEETTGEFGDVEKVYVL